MIGKELIILSITLTICIGYTLKPGAEIVFPLQIEISSHTFVRVDSNNKTTLLECPVGYYFSADELKCQRSDVDVAESDPMGVCPSSMDELLSYSYDCRKFMHCSEGRAVLQDCAAHLLFKREINMCEWPESSDCCEYMENQIHSRSE